MSTVSTVSAPRGLKRLLMPADRRVRRWAAGLGCVVAVTQLLGIALSRVAGIGYWLESPLRVAEAAGVLIGFFAVGYVCAVLLLGWVTGGIEGTGDGTRTRGTERSGDGAPRRKSVPGPPHCARTPRVAGQRLATLYREHPRACFAALVGILCAVRIPYLIWLWPGCLTPDSLAQIRMAIGLDALTNHHPVAHTLIIRLFVSFAAAHGHIYLGIAAYSIAQIVVMAVALAYATMRLLAWGTRRWLVVAAFLIFALSPVISAYSISMWKNIPFATGMLVITVMLIDLARDAGCARRLPWLVGFSVALVAVFLLRSDGPIIALVVAGVALVLARREAWRPLLVALLATLLICGVIRGPVYSAISTPGEMTEALSVPLQQIARASHDQGQNFTAEQRAFVAAVFEGRTPAQVGALYMPEVSDPVKNNASNAWIGANKGEFLRGWARLGLAHPRSYLNSFLANSYGYWFPQYRRWVVSPVVDSALPVPGLTPKRASRTASAILFNPRGAPIIGLAWSIGFCFYLYCAAVAALVLTDQRRLLWTLAPLLVVFLVCLASPVSGEYRYAFGYLIALPVVAAVAFSPGPALLRAVDTRRRVDADEGDLEVQR